MDTSQARAWFSVPRRNLAALLLMAVGALLCSASGWSASRPTLLKQGPTALSADGKTALVGGPRDDGSRGAAWIFVRSPAGTWSRPGAKLIAPGETAGDEFGRAVALSADGNVALVGAPGAKAVWVFGRVRGTWRAESKLGCTGCRGAFGSSVTLAGDGTTALIGAAWVFEHVGSHWVQRARPSSVATQSPSPSPPTDSGTTTTNTQTTPAAATTTTPVTAGGGHMSSANYPPSPAPATSPTTTTTHTPPIL